jgi:hypothetical protein
MLVGCFQPQVHGGAAQITMARDQQRIEQIPIAGGGARFHGDAPRSRGLHQLERRGPPRSSAADLLAHRPAT